MSENRNIGGQILAKQWLYIQEIMQITGLSKDAVIKRIQRGKFKRVRRVKGRGGKGGLVWQVHVSEVMGEVRVAAVEEKKVGEGKDGVKVEEMDVEKREIVMRFLGIRAKGGKVVEEAERLVDEYRRKGMRVSLKSLYRWVKEYEEKGEEAFVSRRGGEKGVRSFDEEALKYGIGLYLDKRKFSIKDCYEMMCERAKEKGWRVGSYKSFARILKEIPEKVKVLAREGEKVYRAEYLPKVRRRTDDLEVNEIWVMDHTPLNIMVYEKGKVIRPWITVAMDLRTRMIAGFAVVRYPSGDSIALALRHGMLKKKPPRILKVEGEFYWPIYGVPRELYLDNGKDFRARRFWGDGEERYRVEVEKKVVKGLKVIGIEPRFATPYWSWSKGWIERFFRTLKGYVQTLPGGWRNRKNMSEQDRSRVKEAIDKGELLKIGELWEMIGIWIAYRYHFTGHRGLPKRNGQYLSPIEYFEEIKEREGVEFRVVSERALDFLLMKTAKKKVFKDGIHLNGFIYQSLELAGYIGQKVDVYWDPLDVSEVYVYVKGRYVCRAVSDMVMSMKREYGDISEGDLRAVQRERRRIEKRDREDSCQEFCVNHHFTPPHRLL